MGVLPMGVVVLQHINHKYLKLNIEYLKYKIGWEEKGLTKCKNVRYENRKIN